MQDKVVIWGIGSRGKRFLSRVGAENIIAAIDSNPAHIGCVWNDIRIISFAEYLNCYESYKIVVTPVNYLSILDVLERHHVTDYCLIEDFFSDMDIMAYALREPYREGNDDLISKLQSKMFPVVSVTHPAIVYPLNLFFHERLQTEEVSEACDVLLSHGLGCNFFLLQWDKVLLEKHLELYFTEDGFLRSIAPHDADYDFKYCVGHSFVLDRNGLYINAHTESGLERMLNSGEELSEAHTLRAKRAIATIVENKLSKYNHQPIFHPNLGTFGRKKVLVIDQVYGDKSISYGMAEDSTFLHMLDVAKKENPDKDIIIKTHPVRSKGHFSNLGMQDGNVYLVDYDINPYSLLERVDEVYVCTSQLGFEALLLGKCVHVFGMPFYAGWGVTDDRISCHRRQRRRSVAEIFYFAYIKYSCYVSIRKNSICEMEDTMDELLELREEFWRRSGL